MLSPRCNERDFLHLSINSNRASLYDCVLYTIITELMGLREGGGAIETGYRHKNFPQFDSDIYNASKVVPEKQDKMI